MNCVTGKPRVGDVLVKRPVRQSALGGNKVHVRLAPQTLAQMAKLRDFLARDGQLVLGLQINLAGVLDVQFIEFRTDLAPDAGLFGVVVEERRAESFQTVLSAQSE